MAKPDYIICLECESEVGDFTWRDGEVRRAVCEVCGNSDADAFSLPEEFDQDVDEDEEEAEYVEDYDDFEDEEEEE
ncbi:MAG: hypothetical protein HY825_08775 [Acidobacteria bacterium]|nr:hypothetical protein [Acidobacteriota bacterium]